MDMSLSKFWEIVKDRSLSKFWEIVKDREVWSATVHGVPKSQTQVSN